MTKKIPLRFNRREDRSHDIFIGCNFRQIAREIRSMNVWSSCFIVSDETVAKLYAKSLRTRLIESGLAVHIVTFPSGERNKTRRVKERVEDRLLALLADRNSLIIALGGGVVGDLAGFVAATLLRGIPFVQVPTTLIAQVDASIGGKVAVDHPRGKNLIGAFHQPKAVYIDPSTLLSLPRDEFRNGMAEVIKYAATMDRSFFRYLERNHAGIEAPTPAILQSVISRCVKLKARVVEKDERESGPRRILNYGHTIGHAVELISNYRISHGQAISIGMMSEAKISQNQGLLSDPDMHRLRSLLLLYDLPVEVPRSFTLDKILVATLSDKKARGGVVNYTLLDGIGKAKVGVGLTLSQVRAALRQ